MANDGAALAGDPSGRPRVNVAMVRADVRLWLVAGLVLATFSSLLGEYLWVVSLVPVGFWLLIGITLALVHIFRSPAPCSFLRRISH